MKSAPIEPSYRKRPAYHGTLLGGMSLLASTALVIGDLSSRADIEQRMVEDMQASLQQVIPASLYDNDLLTDTIAMEATRGRAPHNEIRIYRARKANDIVAFAFQVVGQGYSGAMNILMGVDREGKILGVRIISHAETPGLGDKIELGKSNWVLGFDGLSLSDPHPDHWKVKKDGGQFDQFSGATITPRAVVTAVKYGLEFFHQHRSELILAAPATRHETRENKKPDAAPVPAVQPSRRRNYPRGKRHERL